MDEILTVTVDDVGGVPVVRALGEIDVSTAPRLHSELLAVRIDAPKVVVDLAEVSFLDSTGLGVLVEEMKRRRSVTSDATLDLVVTRPQIRKVLEVTGLVEVFAVHDSLDDAVAP
jgi:anti-sigma B factor antagonist